MDDRTAYRKGWDASRRSTTADLEGAESRFVGRYGSEHHASFVDGWTDYATDSDYQADKGTK